MATSHLELPDEIVRLILGYIPVRELIHLRRVCGQWCVAIDEGICPNKKRLQLFTGTFWSTQWADNLVQHELEEGPESFDTESDYLILSNKNLESARSTIISIFPKITNLTISLDQYLKLDLIGLLKSWPQLTSLTIYNLSGLYELANPARALYFRTQLWLQLNSLQFLECLNFYYVSEYYFPPPEAEQNEVLSRLKRFTLYSYVRSSSNNGNQFLRSLGPECSHLTLDWIHYPIADFKDLIVNSGEELHNQITHLIANNFGQLHNGEWREFYQFLVQKFKNLQSLKLTLPFRASLTILPDILDKLDNLKTLKVSVDSHALLFNTLYDNPTPQLESIRVLQLERFCLCAHARSERSCFGSVKKISLREMFPNLRQIVAGINCDVCVKAHAQLRNFFLDGFGDKAVGFKVYRL